MWIIRLRKCFAATPCKNQRGQGMLEYILILAVAVSLFMLVGRPYLKDLGKKFQGLGKQGFLAEDNTGSNFYYFPIR
jgi:hypothetical protein